MNIGELERKLIAAGRKNAPSDRVPYTFEQRIMELIKASHAVDPWALWGRALWFAAAPCVAIMLLLSAWSVFSPTPAPQASSDLSQELENTVLAAVDQDSSPDSTW